MIFTPADIQARLRDKPFVPVRFVTTTGQAYDIYQPDLVMVGRTAVIIGTPAADTPSVFEAVTRVALVHVTELRDLPAAPAPPADEPSAA